MMTATNVDTTRSHLETIDYKPPSTTISATTTSMACRDEKKMDDVGGMDSAGPSCETAVATTTSGGNGGNGNNDEDHAHNHNDEGDGQFDLYSEEAEWDEGGKSHCGYAEVVHSTLMSVGETVHKWVGEPSPDVEKELKAVGNWFQEASYAARDLFRGTKEGEESSGMQEDAMDAVKTLLRGGSQMLDDDDHHDDGDRHHDKDTNKDPSASPTTAPAAATTTTNTAAPVTA